MRGVAKSDAEWREIAGQVAGKTIMSLDREPGDYGTSAWVMHVAGSDTAIRFLADDTENEVINCVLTGTGISDPPPMPDLACFRFITGPGGGIVVGDEGRLRLGPGSVVRALEGGGMEILVPAGFDFGPVNEALRGAAAERLRPVAVRAAPARVPAGQPGRAVRRFLRRILPSRSVTGP
jgi:hypothetical protein